jgi:hypothetical protein
MPFFRLVSTSSQSLSVEFQGEDASSALSAAKKFCFDEAELWQDGDYILTLRRQGQNRDYWIISREGAAQANHGLRWCLQPPLSTRQGFLGSAFEAA